MKDFKSYLLERAMGWPAFCVTRANMPQIHYLRFRKFIEDLGVGFSYSTETNWDDIHPTQNDFNQEKVDKIIDSYDPSKEKPPIIVSEDGFVLDGHHRYYAASQAKLGWDILAVDLPINKLMKLAYDFIEYDNS